MGLSVVVGYAVLAMASLVWFTTAYGTYDAAQDQIAASERARERIDAQVRGTSFDVTDKSYNPGQDRLTLTATNLGTKTVETDKIDIVLDGVLSLPSDVSVTVEGAANTHWTPGTEAEFVVTNVASNPLRILLTDGYGVQELEAP